MRVTVSHLDGNSAETMVLNAQTSKSNFEIRPSEISPVEYFLAGTIACSTTDMVMLPQKSGNKISNISIDGEVIRNENPPRKFNEVHFTYKFDSDADDLIARRWVLSTLETYCSTINTIRGVSKITFSIVHNGNLIAENDSIMSGDSSALSFDNENAPDIGGACQS
jgi:putative redox protein